MTAYRNPAPKPPEPFAAEQVAAEREKRRREAAERRWAFLHKHADGIQILLVILAVIAGGTCVFSRPRTPQGPNECVESVKDIADHTSIDCPGGHIEAAPLQGLHALVTCRCSAADGGAR